MRVIPVHASTILEISLDMLVWMRHDITRISHDPDCLHTHDHMLENVTMDSD